MLLKSLVAHKQTAVVLLVFSISSLTTTLKTQDCGTPLIKTILQPEPNQLMDLYYSIRKAVNKTSRLNNTGKIQAAQDQFLQMHQTRSEHALVTSLRQ